MVAITELAAQLARDYPLTYLTFITLAALAIMVRSADLTLFGVTKFAQRFGISDYLIGLIAVAIGASMPELASAVTGGFLGDSGIVFGTILGSNFVGLTIVLGIMALIGKRIPLKNKLLDHIRPAIPAIFILPLIMVIDGKLSRADGAILVLIFCAYLFYIWKKEGELGRLENVEFRYIWQHSLIFILALAALLLSARWTVFASVEMARRLDISSFIVATFVIGLGASVPDLVVSLRAIWSGHKDVGMGNIIGSGIAKATLFLGAIGLLTPVDIPFYSVALIGIFTLLATIIIIYYMRTGYINNKEGTLLMILYGIYTVLQLAF